MSQLLSDPGIKKRHPVSSTRSGRVVYDRKPHLYSKKDIVRILPKVYENLHHGQLEDFMEMITFSINLFTLIIMQILRWLDPYYYYLFWDALTMWVLYKAEVMKRLPKSSD